MIFVDTSGVLAMINPKDERHDPAMRQWNELLDRRETFLTTSCVVSELINLAQSRRNLSLVDCASFEVMRRRGLRTAFTLDKHFAEQGFDAVP